jgi:hypothetical protein
VNNNSAPGEVTAGHPFVASAQLAATETLSGCLALAVDSDPTQLYFSDSNASKNCYLSDTGSGDPLF